MHNMNVFGNRVLRKVAVGAVGLAIVVFLVLFVARCVNRSGGLSTVDERDWAILVPRAPQWSPDGEWIAFQYAGGVYVVDHTGSHLQLIDGGGEGLDLAYWPTVAPDGSRIAYAAYRQPDWVPWQRSKGWEIVTARPDGSDKHYLTENDSLDMQPEWLPNGTGLLFLSASGWSTMAADGSDLRLVVDYSDPQWTSIVPVAVLSPDGSQFAFVDNNLRQPGRYSRLYIANTDGTGVSKVAEQAGFPAWYPDGTQLAYAKWVWEDTARVATGLYTADVDGSDKRLVTSFPDGVKLADVTSWSPDGSEIAHGTRVIRVGWIWNACSARRCICLVVARQFTVGGIPKSSPRGSFWRHPVYGRARWLRREAPCGERGRGQPNSCSR